MGLQPQPVTAASTPYQWKTQLLALVIANGWVLHDDQYTNSGNASGYIIIKAAGDAGGKGFIEIWIDGTTTKLRAWHTWNATTHVGILSSVYVSRTHDLASGFICYIGSSGGSGTAGLAMVFKSASALTTCFAAVIKTPDLFANGLSLRSDIDAPRALIVEPDSGLVQPSHWVGITDNIFFGPPNAQWEMNSGDSTNNYGYVIWNQAMDGNQNHYSLAGQLKMDGDTTRQDFAVVNPAWGLGRPVYQPRLVISKIASGVIVAETIWNSLPEIWIGSSAATNETWAKSLLNSQDLYGAPADIWLATAMDAVQTTANLAGNYASLPTPGVFDIQIDDETIRCSSRSGATVTISQRGYRSAPVAHAIGTTATTAFADDFNRANGVPGSNYTLEGTTANATINILSNVIRAVKTNTTAAIVRALVNSASFADSADVSIKFDVNNQISTVFSPQYGSVQFRRTAANNFYEFRIERIQGGTSIGWGLYKTIAGVETTLATSSNTLQNVPSASVEIRMIGSKIKIYLNGQVLSTLAATDSAITSAGQISFGANLGNTGSSTDYFEFDNIQISRIVTPKKVSALEWLIKLGTRTFIRYGLGGG